MIDTVILEIPIEYTAITDHSQFSPSTKEVLDDEQGFSKCVNNPKGADKKSGIYKPRLTVIKRAQKLYLKIEFSLPKLLFGNNLDELEEKDFELIVKTIQSKIKEMGVLLWSYQIEDAEVIGFHPSKNIPLSKGYTSVFVIRELFKINPNQKFDLTRIVYRNNGEELQIYSNSNSCVFYDKIKDLNKPAKRAVDKDQTKQQIDLFNYLKREKRNLEVLKIEVRLNHKDKMMEVLEKVGFADTPLFKNIFKKDLCQKIIKLYWEEFFGKNLFLFSVNNNSQRILQMILMKYPKTKIKIAIFLVGLYQLCKDEEGIRGFRSIAKNYRPKTNWITLSNYLKKFENNVFYQPQHGYIKDIEGAINDFKPLRLNKVSGVIPSLTCKEL